MAGMRRGAPPETTFPDPPNGGTRQGGLGRVVLDKRFPPIAVHVLGERHALFVDLAVGPICNIIQYIHDII